MRLLRLHLKAFGPFSERVLEMGTGDQRLVLVHGPNEAGKSSALRAICDLRFGIPQQSADDFVHPYGEMRIGGVFVDAQGGRHGVLRRKGRGPTLMLTDLEGGETALPGTPAPPELEALLTAGLSREEYEKTFGIDHRRLREGGEELREGKGEIGAALFEASAGVRGISQVLERLDLSARKFFMPGARGRNARINEALRNYDDHQAAFKQALVRPAVWADLSGQHRQAAEDLARLEACRRDLHGRLLLIRELRSVAPLLGTLDHATAMLLALQPAPLLSESAATDRASAESERAAHLRDAELAAAEALRQQERLDGLELDDAILALAPAIRRLGASTEAIDRHRAELAEACADVSAESARAATLARGIDPGATIGQVLERIPGPTARAGIDQRLRAVELAEQKLEQQRESAARLAAETDEITQAAPPSPQARTALRIAQAELARNELLLGRLAELPAEIKAAKRALAAGLESIGLGDGDALGPIRPLLDAEIDEANKAMQRNDTRRAELHRRQVELRDALDDLRQQRAQLLEAGAVPTFDEVSRARQRRDTDWARVRAAYVDAAQVSLVGFAADQALPEAYERAVVEADRLADALAADHQRAARLHSSQREIARLEHDSADLVRQLEAIGVEERDRERQWNERLAAARLPALSPGALRDWQLRLAATRAAAEALQKRLDEFDELRQGEARLASALHAAIVATSLALPAVGASLGTLSVVAAELDETIRHGQQLLDTAAGRRSEREQQRRQMGEREAELARALHAARAALAPLLGALRLPEDAGTAVVRALLAEFDALLAARDRLAAAQAREQRARQVLAVHEDGADAIARQLGDAEPADIRLYAERVSARLGTAEQAAQARALARQALDSALANRRRHQEAAAACEAVLAGLCRAAAVESAAQLPEAEQRSQRKRTAQAELDLASSQLAHASRRSIDELRSLLHDQDGAALDADETACTQGQLQLEQDLQAARLREESARRALQAIDGADTAAAAREAMERAAARVRADMQPWARSRIARALLAEALKRFRERAQGPMLQTASECFARMTDGEFTRLLADDGDERPTLLAERRNGTQLRVEAMSEGTRDQLYLALRLAALELRRAAGVDLPVVLDDVLMTSDDRRAGLMLKTLAAFARGGQVIVFTHHVHVAELARASVNAGELAVVEL